MNDPGVHSSQSHSEADQLDRICDAFEQAWRTHGQAKIEDFLSKVGRTLHDDLMRELIAAEVDLRRENGESVSQQEYLDRFPGKHDVVEQAFALAPKHSSAEGHDSADSRAASTATDAPGTVPEAPAAIPTHIGRYRVERVLGSGKFGIVYLAHDPQLDRPVAIEVPRAQRIGSAGDVQRYIDEAKHAAQLDPLGIVRVQDVQQEGDILFVVQQYVDGQSLRDCLKRERFAARRTAELVAAIAEAVAFAHSRGLVHRDLKPDNILLDCEATEADTEVRLLKGLRKRVSELSPDSSLPEVLDLLRDGRCTPAGKKVLVVLDQFEQWLHAKRGEHETQLVRALRHCDGQHLQCLVMVRDDFWLAVSRFMQALEVDPVPGKNTALVDLFDPHHAQKVLGRFGQAYGAMPDGEAEFNSSHWQFLDDSVQALSEDGKIICVRLSLFADMVKGKPWTPTTLKEVGGAEGIGVTFLEETFSAATAAPKHRLHQKAARAVLQALLPESGSEIKGGMKSREDLLKASNCADKPRDFDDLLRILDGELRLITPTDPEGAEADDHPAATRPRYYQLTHDYLVPSLREWLTRKQKETWRGRAELRLEERTAQWARAQESRFLPNPLEYVSIVARVPRGKWTPGQRQVMRAAGRRYGAMTALGLLLAAALGWAGWEANGRLQADGLVRAIRNASIDQVPALVSQLAPYRHWAGPGLAQLRSDESNPDAQLHAALALLPTDHSQVRYLEERLLFCGIQELPVIRDMLGDHAGGSKESVQAHLRDLLLDSAADSSRRFNAALALATYEPDGAAWNADTSRVVVDRLLSSSVDFQSQYRAALQPARLHLVDATADAAADTARDATPRILATNALVDFGRGRPESLARALVVADERQYPIVLESLRKHPEQALAELQRQLVARPQRVWPHEVDVTKFSDPARDLVAKIENAAGLVERHFALCQSLRLADFATLSDSLRTSGFRPTRIRPYPFPLAPLAGRGAGGEGGARSLHCAALWQRDGRDWQSRPGLTAETLADADREMEQQGLAPVDVAPYLEGTELRYAALWGGADPTSAQDPSHSRPVVKVDLNLEDFQKKLAGELAPSVLQVAADRNDSSPRVAVIWQKKRAGEDVARARGAPRAACFVAVAGATFRGSVVPRAVTTPSPRSAPPSMGFGWCVVLAARTLSENLDPFILLPFLRRAAARDFFCENGGAACQPTCKS